MATEEQIAVFDEYVSQLKEDFERIANELKICGTLGGLYTYSMSVQKLIGQYDTISRKASVAQLTIVPTEFISPGKVRGLYDMISEFTDIIELDDRMEAMGCEVHRRYPRELGVEILSMKTSLEKMYGPFPTRMQRIKDASMDGIMDINIGAGLRGGVFIKIEFKGGEASIEARGCIVADLERDMLTQDETPLLPDIRTPGSYGRWKRSTN